MKKILSFVLTSAWLVSSCSHPVTENKDRVSIDSSSNRIESLSRQPEPKLDFPKVDIQTLPNGLKVYLMENHDLPVFEMAAFVRGGTLFDPEGQEGVGGLLGALLRTGGTTKRSVQEIDRFLDNRGASIETGMKTEFTTAGLHCLTKDKEELIPLFFEILSSPAFDEKQLTLLQARQIESLKRVEEEPEAIVKRKFPPLVYGNSPWGKKPTIHSIQSVTRKNLIERHQKGFSPDETILAISGDFEKEKMIETLQKASESWKKSPETLPTVKALEKEWKPETIVIDKSGNQSTVITGHLGEKRSNPDRFALMLMDEMLGGDIFSSKLGEEIRTNRGLAYSVYSNFSFETDFGLFYVMAQTKTEKTAEVLQLIQKTVESFQKGEGIQSDALELSRQSLLNQTYASWEPPFNYVKERARLGFYGYPENYLEIFHQKMKETSLQEVQAAAKKYLFPEKLKVLIVGDLPKIKPELEKLGGFKEEKVGVE